MQPFARYDVADKKETQGTFLVASAADLQFADLWMETISSRICDKAGIILRPGIHEPFVDEPFVDEPFG